MDINSQPDFAQEGYNPEAAAGYNPAGFRFQRVRQAEDGINGQAASGDHYQGGWTSNFRPWYEQASSVGLNNPGQNQTVPPFAGYDYGPYNPEFIERLIKTLAPDPMPTFKVTETPHESFAHLVAKNTLGRLFLTLEGGEKAWIAKHEKQKKPDYRFLHHMQSHDLKEMILSGKVKIDDLPFDLRLHYRLWRKTKWIGEIGKTTRTTHISWPETAPLDRQALMQMAIIEALRQNRHFQTPPFPQQEQARREQWDPQEAQKRAAQADKMARDFEEGADGLYRPRRSQPKAEQEPSGFAKNDSGIFVPKRPSPRKEHPRHQDAFTPGTQDGVSGFAYDDDFTFAGWEEITYPAPPIEMVQRADGVFVPLNYLEKRQSPRLLQAPPLLLEAPKESLGPFASPDHPLPPIDTPIKEEIHTDSDILTPDQAEKAGIFVDELLHGQQITHQINEGSLPGADMADLLEQSGIQTVQNMPPEPEVPTEKIVE